MYVRIANTGVGFETYQEQVDAGMGLHHLHGNYYSLTSKKPTPEEICRMFGYVPVQESEVYPPAPIVVVPEPPSLADRLSVVEAQNAEYSAIIEDAIMRGVL